MDLGVRDCSHPLVNFFRTSVGILEILENRID